MRIFVKICGFRTREAIAAAVEAGADALGFVFAESPRQVSPDEARALCEGIPDHVVRVAVMRDPRPEQWEAVWRGFRPDWLQAEAGCLATLALDAAVQALPVYRDVPDLDEAALAAAPRVLFEAGTSGAGVQADWTRASTLAARTQLVLAGGLAPDNVAEAIRRVRPWGVDVSSGVERERGVKDPKLIAAFVNAARSACVGFD